MSRIMMVSLIVVGFLGLSFNFLLASYRDSRMEEVQARERSLNEVWSNMKVFEADLARTLNEVRDGLPLGEAIYQVEHSAQEHFPRYLTNLKNLEKYPTIKEQVAHNILRYFQVAIELQQDAPQSQALVQRLEKEIQGMFPEENCSCPKI
jgi:hypothetical protein